MYRPFLFVGLGGSGGKTLRYLKRGVQEWLADQEWDGPIPAAWQFLHIDTPTIPDGKELNAYVPMLDPSEYVGLIGEGVTYQSVASTLESVPNMDDELVGWRIDPVALGVPISLGAGQYRAVGRTIAMLQGRQVRLQLKNAFDRIKAPAARADLGNLYTKASGKAPDSAYPAPVVVVVSSLAGGTGAGLFMNVCDLINEMRESEEPIALLYTPEVFGSIAGAGGGVFPNSLAAISELLNGHWLRGATENVSDSLQIPARDNRDKQFAGGARPLRFSGPAYPFLIGLRNAAGAAFGTDRALFSMIGKALVSWLTDSKVQDQVVAYTKGNWESAAASNQPTSDVLVNSGTQDEMGLPAFSALGVAQLSIGLDYLEDYCAERLALDAANWIAKAHTESDAALAIIEQDGIRQPDQLAARIAERELPLFLKRCGLAEQGPDDNQVIDALRPDDQAMRLAASSAAGMQAQLETGGTASAAVWAERIYTGTEFALKTYIEGFVQAMHGRATTWIQEAPTRVLEATETMIAVFGVKVAAELCRATAVHMTEQGGVCDELLRDVQKYEHWGSANLRLDTINGQVQSLSGKVQNNHPALEQALEDALHSGSFIGEAQVAGCAAEMLRSFAQHFLRPLAAELDGEAVSLAEDLAGEAANWVPWSDGTPPNHLTPPPSQILLIEPDSFSQVFRELLEETFPAQSESERRLQVRHAVTTGSFLRSDSTQSRKVGAARTAITVTSEWWPGHSVVPYAMKSQSQANFRVGIRPEELKVRASAWMWRENSPFAMFLRETLRTYLQRDTMFAGSGKPQQVYEKRQAEFLPKLQAVLSASAPLIGLDNNLLGMLHPALAHKPYIPIVSQLPFKNHELEQRVLGVLTQALDGASLEAEALLTSDQLATTIDVSSTLSRPCSPLVIKSLLEPVSQEWVSAQNSGVSVLRFWQRRRARPLSEFIPLPQAHIVAMTRGWFTARSVGLVSIDSLPVRISRLGDTDVYFPRVLLSKSSDPRDLLPMLLEALPLAYVEVGTVGNLSPLAPYIALRDVGRCGRDADTLLDYPRLGYVLEDWARDGAHPAAIVQPLVEGESELERLERLCEVLQNSKNDYAEDYSSYRAMALKDRKVLGGEPWWAGIEWHINTSLDQLIAALQVSIGQAKTANKRSGRL